MSSSPTVLSTQRRATRRPISLSRRTRWSRRTMFTRVVPSRYALASLPTASRDLHPKRSLVWSPITSGKLLRAGGPSNANNKPKPRAYPRSTPVAAKLPGSGATSAAARPIAAAAITTASVGAVRSTLGTSPPPPPPAAAAPVEPQVPRYKALYAFATENAGEMALEKDDVVEVTQKDETGSGWWLVKKNGVEGWAPSNYLELIPQAPPKPKPAPAPPVKRAPPPAPSATGSDRIGSGQQTCCCCQASIWWISSSYSA